VAAAGQVPVGTSGRNTRSQLASKFNATGSYSIVRHPLYLGNFLTGLGAVMVPYEFWLLAAYVTTFWLYYERIMFAEEEFLESRFGDQFQQWASATPAFIPRVSLWQPAKYSFSWRTVVKREYTALFVVILLHASQETLENWIVEHRIVFEPFWVTLLASGAVAYVVIRHLKRKTVWLDVAGR
jgi:protein-S-isoprenylcysteine O-methyltransferase Ste14